MKIEIWYRLQFFPTIFSISTKVDEHSYENYFVSSKNPKRTSTVFPMRVCICRICTVGDYPKALTNSPTPAFRITRFGRIRCLILKLKNWVFWNLYFWKEKRNSNFSRDSGRRHFSTTSMNSWGDSTAIWRPATEPWPATAKTTCGIWLRWGWFFKIFYNTIGRIISYYFLKDFMKILNLFTSKNVASICIISKLGIYYSLLKRFFQTILSNRQNMFISLQFHLDFLGLKVIFSCSFRSQPQCPRPLRVSRRPKK